MAIMNMLPTGTQGTDIPTSVFPAFFLPATKTISPNPMIIYTGDDGSTFAIVCPTLVTNNTYNNAITFIPFKQFTGTLPNSSSGTTTYTFNVGDTYELYGNTDASSADPRYYYIYLRKNYKTVMHTYKSTTAPSGSRLMTGITLDE